MNNEILNTGFAVHVNEDSSYKTEFFNAPLDSLFRSAREVLSCEYVSVVFPNTLPAGYCLLVDDDASALGRKVSAIGTFLFGHYLEDIPLCGPFLIVKYFENENRQKVFSFLSEREANEVTDCLEKQVVPRIKKALEAMIRKKKKEKFTVI